VAVALHRSGAHCGRSGFSSAEFKLEFVRMKLQRRRLRHDVPDIPATSVSRRGFGQLKVTTGLSSAFRFVIRRIVKSFTVGRCVQSLQLDWSDVSQMSYFALDLRPATAGCFEWRRMQRLPNFFHKIRVPCRVDRQADPQPPTRMGGPRPCVLPFR
jgi:hypothetical protein